DRRPDADEREPHTAAVAGAAHGRFRRAERAAESEFVFELPVDGGGSRADTGDAAGADDFADRSRCGIVASAGRVAPGKVSGAAVAVGAVDWAAERYGGALWAVHAGACFAR